MREVTGVALALVATEDDDDAVLAPPLGFGLAPNILRLAARLRLDACPVVWFFFSWTVGAGATTFLPPLEVCTTFTEPFVDDGAVVFVIESVRRREEM